MAKVGYNVASRSYCHPAIDQAWYEKAADIIGGNVASAEERLEKLNEIWESFLLHTSEYFHPRPMLVFKATITDEQMRQAINEAIIEHTGFCVEQIVKFAKEMTTYGTTETHETAADPE